MISRGGAIFDVLERTSRIIFIRRFEQCSLGKRPSDSPSTVTSIRSAARFVRFRERSIPGSRIILLVQTFECRRDTPRQAWLLLNLEAEAEDRGRDCRPASHQGPTGQTPRAASLVRPVESGTSLAEDCE